MGEILYVGIVLTRNYTPRDGKECVQTGERGVEKKDDGR